jgi:hypothetical protein
MSPCTVRRMSFANSTLVLAALLALAPAPASAGPILPNTWYEFAFTTAGIAATGCFPNDPAGPLCIPSSGAPTVFADAPPWTFSGPGQLTVVDAFEAGDMFEVLDFGVPIGLTSLAGQGDCGDDPVPCLADPAMSSGVFALGAGDHSLTIVPTAAPTEGGVAYFRIAVPEPGLVLLLTSGVAWFGLRRARQTRRRARAVSSEPRS